MQLPQFQAHAELEEIHWWFTARREIVRVILHQVLPPSRECSIVDVGCGTGGNTTVFDQEYRCMGIDPDPDAIAFARSRFPECRFVLGFAPQDIPDDMRRADVVLLLDVLEHVERDAELIRDLLRAMKPGAYLFIMVPADPRLWSPHDRGFGHFRRYTTESLRALWQGQPAIELLLSPCNARLYWPIRLLRIFLRLLGKPFGQGDSDLSLSPLLLNSLLHRIFVGETRRLLHVLHGKARPYRHGVSLLALLRREGG